MDFNYQFDSSLLDADKEFKILGLDSDEPILQLGTLVFKGEWKDTTGTLIFFQEDDTEPKMDVLMTSPPSKMLKFTCKTNKLLHMSRIFVNLKTKKDKEESVAKVGDTLASMDIDGEPPGEGTSINSETEGNTSMT
ncbi:hypothetical protein AAG570_011163 [Ranatra chinensis]|uniref:Transcription factor TFIIIC triple barrel domain-containing protein n=1 Tax=Ranatra chinensis TaxID=642074 RepID=A0ABD0YJU4_9HEMI